MSPPIRQPSSWGEPFTLRPRFTKKLTFYVCNIFSERKSAAGISLFPAPPPSVFFVMMLYPPPPPVVERSKACRLRAWKPFPIRPPDYCVSLCWYTKCTTHHVGVPCASSVSLPYERPPTFSRLPTGCVYGRRRRQPWNCRSRGHTVAVSAH